MSALRTALSLLIGGGVGGLFGATSVVLVVRSSFLLAGSAYGPTEAHGTAFGALIAGLFGAFMGGMYGLVQGEDFEARP